jgi:Ca2+-transporting ATPase
MTVAVVDSTHGSPVLQVRRREAASRRLRLYVPTLYRNPRVAASLQQGLAAHEALERFQLSCLTGTLLLVPADWKQLPAALERVAVLSGCRTPPSATAAGESMARPDPPAVPAAAHAGQEEAPAEWHSLPLARVIERLLASESGLGEEEAKQRLARFGPNTVAQAEPRSPLQTLLEQFVTLPVGLLGVSAVISVATGGVADAAVILGVVLINAAIGYFTERQAEKTIAALSRSGPRHARALRDGRRLQVPVEQIVPGDVLQLEPGSYVAADARLLATRRLTVDESALTGESMPVRKDHHGLLERDTPLGDRLNMLHMGSHVTGGDGLGMVVSTGRRTELGRIQALVDSARSPETPMERQLGHLGTQLGLLSAAVCVAVFGVGVLRGVGLVEMLKGAVSLAVAAVPEGLPAVATTTLALGIREMQRHRVAVRQLGAVETLGSVQTLCLDKTGTLTRNHMSVVEVYFDGGLHRVDGGPLGGEGLAGPTLTALLEVAALCNEAEIAADGSLSGSPTEQALLEAAIAGGVDLPGLYARWPRLELRPRAEGRPLMSSLHADSAGRRRVAVKGSPAEVLERCSHLMLPGQRVALGARRRAQILAANERMAGDALRVLGVALGEGSQRVDADAHALTWLGLVGLADPLRPNMPELVAAFHRAGIDTVMITGDQAATAEAIGRRLGLSSGQPLQILDSRALERLDPALLSGLARNVHVFARVSPAHKLQIVQALQRAGRVVAMTGDGINDGPALKAADIGVALGAGGSEVARQVSDVVIEDDNLETLITAVRHGRGIYANIRKTIHFLLATNFSEIEVMLVGIALGLGQPLTPMQLLWINLLSDIFPGLALSMERADPGLMERGPRDPAEPVVGRRDLGRMTRESAVITAAAMGAYGFGRWRYGAGPQAGSLAFNTLTSAQLLHAYVCRSDRRVAGAGLPPNRYLDLAVGLSLGLQLLTVLVPPLRRLLGTTPHGPLDLAMILAGALGSYLVNELSKPGPAGKESTQ